MRHQKGNPNCLKCHVPPILHKEVYSLDERGDKKFSECEGLVHSIITSDGVILGDKCDVCDKLEENNEYE